MSSHPIQRTSPYSKFSHFPIPLESHVARLPSRLSRYFHRDARYTRTALARAGIHNYFSVLPFFFSSPPRAGASALIACRSGREVHLCVLMHRAPPGDRLSSLGSPHLFFCGFVHRRRVILAMMLRELIPVGSLFEKINCFPFLLWDRGSPGHR